jgi:DNA-binding GntR family transcriptional regulator
VYTSDNVIRVDGRTSRCQPQATDGKGVRVVESPFHRPPTTQEAVLDELRELIRSGRLGPGEHIVQDSLADDLGISRVPLREALKIMQAEGHVTYAAHRGYAVAELSVADLREIHRIRELIEPEAIRAAMAAMTLDHVRRIEELEGDVRAAAATGDVVAMSQANRRFHQALLEPCGLPRLLWHIGLLWDATEVYRLMLYADDSGRERVETEHRRVVQAVVAADVEGVVQQLAEHRAHAFEVLCGRREVGRA